MPSIKRVYKDDSQKNASMTIFVKTKNGNTVTNLSGCAVTIDGAPHWEQTGGDGKIKFRIRPGLYAIGAQYRPGVASKNQDIVDAVEVKPGHIQVTREIVFLI